MLLEAKYLRQNCRSGQLPSFFSPDNHQQSLRKLVVQMPVIRLEFDSSARVALAK
jgi:hypothetical protein